MLVGDVYLNGRRIGGTDYGYLGFDVDITRLIRFGKPNVIAVKADTGKPENSRWYTGGGLFRDVNLVATDAKQYFMRNPLYITTPVVGQSKATVNVRAEIACFLKSKDINVGTRIVDAGGKVVYEKMSTLPFNRKQKTNEYQVDSIVIDNPHLWSCESPYLYKATLTIYHKDGSVADCISENFGIRLIEYSPKFWPEAQWEESPLERCCQPSHAWRAWCCGISACHREEASTAERVRLQPCQDIT